MVAVFVICGILVLVLGSRQIYRLSTSPAWVASSDLEAGQVIGPENLKRARSGDDGGIEDPRALLGKLLQVDKEKGEVFRPTELSTPPKGWLAAKVPEGRVLYTLTPKSSAIPHNQIRYGDRIDVLVRGAGGVRMVARNALLMGALSPKGQRAAQAKGRGLLTALAAPAGKSSKSDDRIPLILAVAPNDVYPLASVGSGEEVTLVLHGEKEVKEGELLAINSTLRQIEVVNGLERSRTSIRR